MDDELEIICKDVVVTYRSISLEGESETPWKAGVQSIESSSTGMKSIATALHDSAL
jgi:hypothetical protein